MVSSHCGGGGCDTTLVGVLVCFVTASTRMEIQFLHLTFVVWAGWGHSFFSGPWLEESGYCLKVFCVSGLPPSFGSLTRENRFSLGLFLSVPIGVSQLPASSVPSLGCMREKENPSHSPCATRSLKVAAGW